MSLQTQYQRYLRILGFEDIPSGLDGLRRIVRAHLQRAPFENLSKLLLFAREGGGRFLSFAEILDGMEHHDLGGTCHSLNPYLGDLLRSLGYDVDLLGADMGTPEALRCNVHTCLRVRIGGTAYHVDVGYGGPFREPIRLDRMPHEIKEGDYRYVLERKGDDFEMSVWLGAERVHGYTVHDTPRFHQFFEPAMLGSFQPAAPFLNCIRICRIFPAYSVTLLDRTLSIHRDGRTTNSELNTAAEWSAAVANHLSMPRSPAEEALRVLERHTGKPLFPAMMKRQQA